MSPARIAAWAAITWTTVLLRPAAGDVIVDLTTRPWIVKPAFAPEDARGFAGGVTTEAFPIIPNTLFDVPLGAPLQEAALETTFMLDSPRAPGGGLLGLGLATIGENWAIYVNGVELAADMHVRDGRIERRRSVRDLVVALPPGVARAGENRLVVHLVGDAPVTRLTANTAFGFYQRDGYVVAPLTELLDHRRDYASLVLVAMFAVFVVFAAMLAIYRPGERHHRRFALLCATLAVYYASRANVSFDLIPDTAWITRAEYATVAAAGALVFLFLHAFFYAARPWPPFVRFFVPFSAVACAAALVVPFAYTDAVLLAWQSGAAVAALYLVWYIGRAAAARVPDAGRLLPSLVLLSAAVLWDIADSQFLLSQRRYGQYAFGFFMATLAYVIAYRAVRMRNETLRENAALRDREERLRVLFEASFEALVLHAGGEIVDANPSFTRLFGYDLDQVRGRPVASLFDARGGFSADGSAGEPREARAKRRDGTSFYAEYVNRPWAWDGRIGEVLVIRDVDAPKRAAAELSERNQELELLVRSMKDREAKLRELEQEVAARRAAAKAKP